MSGIYEQQSQADLISHFQRDIFPSTKEILSWKIIDFFKTKSAYLRRLRPFGQISTEMTVGWPLLILIMVETGSKSFPDN